MNLPFGGELELKLNRYICIARNKNDPTCVLKRQPNAFLSRTSRENNTVIPLSTAIDSPSLSTAGDVSQSG